MTKWEYRFEIGKFEEFNALTKTLDELGEDGWEAVGITGDVKGDEFTVLLKRTKTPAPFDHKAAGMTSPATF